MYETGLGCSVVDECWSVLNDGIGRDSCRPHRSDDARALASQWELFLQSGLPWARLYRSASTQLDRDPLYRHGLWLVS